MKDMLFDVGSHFLGVTTVILEQDIFFTEEVEHGIEKGSDITGEDHSVKKEKTPLIFPLYCSKIFFIRDTSFCQ